VCIYELLSFFAGAWNGGRHALCLLVQTGDVERDRQQTVLFIKNLLDGGPLDPGIYRLSAKVLWLSAESIRLRYSSEIARELLQRCRSIENGAPQDQVPSDIIAWRDNMKKAFDDAYSTCADQLSRQFAEMSFSVEPHRFTARFGYAKPTDTEGRRGRLRSLIEALRPDAAYEALRSQDATRYAELFYLFQRALRPFTQLETILGRVEWTMPRCYDFPGTGSEEIPDPVLDPESGPDDGAPALPATPVWTSNPDLRNIVSQIAAISEGLRELGRMRERRARRSQRQNLEARLSEMLNALTLLVQSEEEAIKSDNDLLRRSPELFMSAYDTCWADFLRPFLVGFLPELWGSRRLIFRLPLWVPAPLFSRSRLVTSSIGLLLQGLRLLNLYQFLTASLACYRNSMTESFKILQRVRKRLPGLPNHLRNIDEELNLTSNIESPEPTWTHNPQMLEVTFNDPGDPKELIQTAILASEPLLTEHSSAIAEWARRSRIQEEDPVVPDPFSYWISANFQEDDAWRVSEQMIKAVAGMENYQKHLSLDDDRAGCFAVCNRDRIPAPLQDDDWCNWKRLALQHTDSPLKYDALRMLETINAQTKEPVGLLLDRGLADGFFILDTQGNIGLTDVTYPWLDDHARRVFFQRKTGLGRREFHKKCDSFVLRALWPWVFWTCDATECRIEWPIVSREDPDAAFSVIMAIDTDRAPNHGYFGKPEIHASDFMLVDSLDPVLMRLFAPSIRQAARSRFFTETILKNLLLGGSKRNRTISMEMKQLLTVYSDYCLFKQLSAPDWGELGFEEWNSDTAR